MNKKRKNRSKFWPKILFFLFSMLLVTTNATDADLLDVEVIPNNTFESTTLDFSNRNTANNSQMSSLFNVVGMIPGGFQVEALRVKKDGELDFGYQVLVESSPGDAGYCDALDIRVLNNFSEVYEGGLKEFIYNSQVSEQGYDDLVMFISFNDQNVYFANKTCNFNFIFNTTVANSGFADEEIVQNQIGSGTWSN